MKSASRILLVVARKPAVLMDELGPNRMPSPLTMKTRPFAVSVPSRNDGPCPPITRLSAIELLFGWLKVVVSPLKILNVAQLMIAFWLDWLMVTEAEPWPWMVAVPPTTVPPLGPAIAK